MSNCEQTGCTGHLGRFDSCRDEALFELMLDTGSGAGDGDFGYATRISLAEPEQVELPSALKVIAPAGEYIVWQFTSGAVAVTEHRTADEADGAFAQFETELAAFNESPGPERQPRERAIPCDCCGHETWALDSLCEYCTKA